MPLLNVHFRSPAFTGSSLQMLDNPFVSDTQFTHDWLMEISIEGPQWLKIDPAVVGGVPFLSYSG